MPEIHINYCSVYGLRKCGRLNEQIREHHNLFCETCHLIVVHLCYVYECMKMLITFLSDIYIYIQETLLFISISILMNQN